jgi:hypothetical protein
MSPQRKINALLEQAGAVLVRAKNHKVYRLPNGRNFVVSQSPSDYRAAQNQLCVLRRVLRGAA